MVATQLADNVKQKIANYNGTRVLLDYVDYISIFVKHKHILIYYLLSVAIMLQKECLYSYGKPRLLCKL